MLLFPRCIAQWAKPHGWFVALRWGQRSTSQRLQTAIGDVWLCIFFWILACPTRSLGAWYSILWNYDGSTGRTGQSVAECTSPTSLLSSAPTGERWISCFSLDKKTHGFWKASMGSISSMYSFFHKKEPLVVLSKKSPNTLHQHLFLRKRRLWWYKGFCSFKNPSARRGSTTVTITQVWFLGFIALGCLSPAANEWIRCDKGDGLGKVVWQVLRSYPLHPNSSFNWSPQKEISEISIQTTKCWSFRWV